MIRAGGYSILFLLCAHAIAQGENNIWYFGEHAGIDFNQGVPVALLDGQVSTSEGCAVASDPAGALLFYTDGMTVWDRDHQQMPNGFDLDGGASSTQSALIVPIGTTGNYYIISAEDIWTSTKNLSYSIVDMSLNGGYGDVTVKNEILLQGNSEKLAGTRHGNGAGHWVISHSDLGDAFQAFLVTNAGISSTPVISNVGQAFAPYDGVGQMKISADGSKLALACWGTHFVELFDLDPLTGVVFNVRHIVMPPSFNSVYGLEFSASGQRLYAANVNPGEVFQWDLINSDVVSINGSRTMISPGNGTSRGHLQLGPDGRIYLANEYSEWLSVINAPEALGVACNMQENGFHLGGMTSELGLPNVIHGSGHGPTNIVERSIRINVQPTIFNDHVEVWLGHGLSGEARLRTYGATGILIKDILIKDVSTPTRIELGSLPEGAYLIECVHGDDRYRSRVIKQ